MFQFHTVCVLAVLYVAQCSCFDGCLDLAKDIRIPVDGTRVFKPPRSNVGEHVVYCQFLSRYGYTFTHSINRYFADTSDLKIVFLHINGSQSETLISPGDNRDVISADHVNKNPTDGENLVINKCMYPFVTYSIMNLNNTDMTNTLSYMANGERVTASPCLEVQPDDSEKFVWSFLFNRENKPSLHNNRHSESEYLNAWINSATPASVSLPRNFFAFFEMRYTPCDEVITADNFEDIIGAAVGTKYVVKCPEPEKVRNGYFSLTGYRFMDNVTYFCDPGYEMVDYQILTCNEKGEWIGELPCCKKIMPRSCTEVLTKCGATFPGEYLIYGKHNVPNIVYCEFREDHVITFIHPSGLLGIEIDDLYNDDSKILVRARYPDGRQVESVHSQTLSNKNVPLKIKLTHSGTMMATFWTPIDNEDGHSPDNVSIGYNVNGEDVETILQHCCYDQSEADVNFIVFLGDVARIYNEKGPDLNKLGSQFNSRWLTEAKPLPGETYMPHAIYSNFRFRVGHDSVCRSPVSVAGIAIGIISKL